MQYGSPVCNGGLPKGGVGREQMPEWGRCYALDKGDLGS